MEQAPFGKEHQLCHELEINGTRIVAIPSTAVSAAPQIASSGSAATGPGAATAPRAAPAPSSKSHTTTTLPGDPRVELADSHIGEHLRNEFMTEDLNKLAPHLWLMTTQSSENVSSLTEQLVRGREIVISENPGLHLVWIDKRVFLKPLPQYLLSHAFWEHYLLNSNAHIATSVQADILRAARGFLRTYAHLIQHESDFVLATQDKTRLIPKNITFADFVPFINRCKNAIGDGDVSPRYQFGELRLTRLNFWFRVFLHRTTYHKVEWEYSAYFARYYAPLLFIFAVFSVLLSAMQVVLAVRTVLESSNAWLAFARAARGFALFAIVLVACVIASLLFVSVVLILRETVFALKDRARKSAKPDQEK